MLNNKDEFYTAKEGEDVMIAQSEQWSSKKNRDMINCAKRVSSLRISR